MYELKDIFSRIGQSNLKAVRLELFKATLREKCPNTEFF